GVSLPVFGYCPDNAFIDRTRAAAPRGVGVDVPADGDPAPVTVRVGRGLAVRGTVRDRSGRPVAGAVVFAQNDGQPYRRAAATADGEGRFVVSGVAPQVAA